jgi:signal transduction histidine kinase/integral membrane sensor domain MASE1
MTAPRISPVGVWQRRFDHARPQSTASLPRADAVRVASVASAYFLGSLVGVFLRLPPLTTSLVWPPNSILTTALLFTPVRKWWQVLLAALPAHLLLQWGMFPRPGPLVWALFLTNCSEALIAAGLMRRLSDDPTRFDTLRRVVVCLVSAAVIAPIVSSFLDAAAVSTFTTASYWTVMKVRVPSNMLAALVVIPAGASIVRGDWKRARVWSHRQWLENALAVLFVVAAIVGSIEVVSASHLAGFAQLALLPLLLWTAVRFGSTGTSAFLLTTVLVLVGGAIYGHGPLTDIPAHERVFLVQTFLIAAGMPIMCIAALIEERRRDEVSLRSFEATSKAILASLPSHVVVLDRAGRLITANKKWRSFASSAGLIPDDSSGEDRLAVLDALSNHRLDAIRSIGEGVQGVMNGRLEEFFTEFTIEHEAQRWFSVSVVPLHRPEGGVVMTHTEITEQRRAEMAAHQSREELAHVGRVWVLGELTASLSHQLNQPLAAIASNAKAGRRFAAQSPPPAEISNIFEDIGADAARAAEIIQGVRDLLKKGTGARMLVDVNDLVRQTIQLVRGESIARKVTLRLSLATALPLVRANRVQLQQVMLNLLLNAMEATSGRRGEGIVLVRTAVEAPHGVRVSVLDSGPGFGAGDERQLFEPFYTTKPAGMGMGLAIARSIVETHGGLITAAHRDTGGAVFTFTLPVNEPADGKPL